jgi:hypothetical protein
VRHGHTRCVGGPLDGQTIETESSLWFEVVFPRGKIAGPSTYVYSYEFPEGIGPEDVTRENWTEIDWIAEYRPEINR